MCILIIKHICIENISNYTNSLLFSVVLSIRTIGIQYSYCSKYKHERLCQKIMSKYLRLLSKIC